MVRLNENEKLARDLKRWRGKVPARMAADALGIPLRTFEGIEQGRGFTYARLLRLALDHVELEQGE